MKTTPRGTAINEELASLRTAVQKEESESANDATAEFCRALEESRGVFLLRFKASLGIFALASQANESWRLSVFRGTEAYTAEADDAMKNLFREWLGLSDLVRQRAEFYERHGPRFEDGLYITLRLYRRAANQILYEWKKPSISTSKALRVRFVSKDDAASLGFAVAE